MENSSDKAPAQEAQLVEAISPNALELTERASIDSQIATAKKYPRSLQAFKKRAVDMATIDEETAESCLYRRPVGKKNGEQQYAEGMSVRMAEIVGASYGNLRVKAFIVEQTDRFVRACGQAIDLETNFASSSEAIESTVDSQGRPYSERQRLLVAKVALSKARRDATFQVVPRALARPVESAVRELLMGNTETLTRRREKVISWIKMLGIDPKRVYAALKIAGEADLGVEQLEMLTGIRTAIRDNETSVDEAFPKDDTVRKPIFTPPPGAAQQGDPASAGTGKPQTTAAEKPNPDLEPSTPLDREKVIAGMKEAMLDGGVSESKLFKHAKEAGDIPEGIDELFAAPTTALAKISLAIPALAKKK